MSSIRTEASLVVAALPEDVRASDRSAGLKFDRVRAAELHAAQSGAPAQGG